MHSTTSNSTYMSKVVMFYVIWFRVYKTIAIFLSCLCTFMKFNCFSPYSLSKFEAQKTSLTIKASTRMKSEKAMSTSTLIIECPESTCFEYMGNYYF